MNKRLEEIVEETRRGLNVDETVKALCEYISELEKRIQKLEKRVVKLRDFHKYECRLG